MVDNGELNIKVCIIDSGIDINHKRIDKSKVCKSVEVYKDSNDKIEIRNNCEDNIGHGTAITSIINRYEKDVEIYSIKIFTDEFTCDNDKLLFALEYVEENIECNVLNLSLGFTSGDYFDEIKEVLYKLYQKGVIIVSAFDNGGFISYPAALPFVIGVDNDPNCLRYNEFISYDNTLVNVGAFGNLQRVAWKDSQLMMVIGASYAAAYVTVQAVKFLKEGKQNLNDILNAFKEISKYKVDGDINSKKKNNNVEKMIKNAIVFPFNKEVHSLVNFRGVLNFNLVDVYDHSRMGKVGKKISSRYDNRIEYIIKSIDEIDWNEEFETVIIGHTFDISKVLNVDIVYKIIKLCVQYNKNIYSFDDLSNYKNIYSGKIDVKWPKKDKEDLPEYSFNKLYNIETPVLGVFGTSSKQGKYTLQLMLRELFMKDGYNVGQLGTEPSAELFGMDDVYPMGFNSNVTVEGDESIIMLNSIMNKIDLKKRDIILVGCQSGIVPYSFSNMAYIPSKQINFLLGTVPDAVILCINPFDEISYIKRSIGFMESLINCKVIATVLFPMNFNNDWARIMDTRIAVDDSEMFEFVELIKSKTNLPCYILGKKNEMKSLYDECINYFS